jgi:hydroxymethylglutaryl-CoA lyase
MIQQISTWAMIKIVECPRDAMQGFHNFIPTESKINYINALLKVGFYAIDCGSFVSPKAIPHLADTHEVIQNLESELSASKLLVIVANERGAEEACQYNKISTIGFPFSISEQFQLRNTNQSTEKAIVKLKNIQKICDEAGKELLVYLSMGFGNPYNEFWSIELALDWCKKLSDYGIKFINLSDTIGQAKENDITELFKNCQSQLTHIEFGAHFHTRPDNYLKNISAAYQAGCIKFDAAINGLGGCPFAADKLTGNLPTEHLLDYLNSQNIDLKINSEAFQNALVLANKTFL